MSNGTGPNEKRVAIIGGGPGGYAAAFAGADLRLNVTLIDVEPDPGGVCLHRGCIPSKALLHVAKVLTDAREAEHWGITFGKPAIDLAKMREGKIKVVERMTSGLGALCKSRNVTYLRGRASFTDSNTLHVTDERGGHDTDERFDYVVIASGSRPMSMPDLFVHSPRIMNSTDALEIADIPTTLLVVGGGYIGLELGSVYAALGSKVSVVEMSPAILPGADDDLVRVLSRRMQSVFDSMSFNSKVVATHEEKDGVKVTIQGPDGTASDRKFEKVLVCIGRKPNSSGLALNSTKVEVDERGFIKVDNQRRTTDPCIFAVGDVAGEPMLAHKASHEGRIAVEVIAGRDTTFEPRAIPAVVFTDPELAWCGLTENQAVKEGRDVNIARFPWTASGRASTLNRNDGLTKVLTDPETGLVLGVGIVGAGAGELISEGALAIEMGALADDIRFTIHPHPTLGETIMESAEIIFGSGTHVYHPQAG
ncbi:MAG: dihydrolipoyl dehydrogenase [Candidatus Hydrogenedentes bacterium]|nr:dihydrolipoyl dehydrogenase [Candidatus Hydrogenedentota bacterium]